jgi:hypothetical protein
MKLIGYLLIFSVFVYFAVNLSIYALIIAFICVGFNFAHGLAVWPDDYYRKAKKPVTWKQKCNPFWWFGNQDDNVTLEKNNWYLPDKPTWYRRIRWGIRNPLENFDRYVLGFWDKQDWWSRGRWERNPDGWNGKDTMWPLPGEKWSVCLPFISYVGDKWEFYWGWKPNSEAAIFPCIRRR